MRKQQIQFGHIYLAKVSNKIVPVRIGNPCSRGGWFADNLVTNHRVLIKTAGRLRKEITQSEADSYIDRSRRSS